MWEYTFLSFHRLRCCDTYPRLQLSADLSEGHVLLHTVHSILELNAGNVHIGNHRSDVSHDGGEYQDSSQKVSHHEQVFGVIFRRGRLTDCSESQGGPVERINVLPGQSRVPRSI